MAADAPSPTMRSPVKAWRVSLPLGRVTPPLISTRAASSVRSAPKPVAAGLEPPSAGRLSCSNPPAEMRYFDALSPVRSWVTSVRSPLASRPPTPEKTIFRDADKVFFAKPPMATSWAPKVISSASKIRLPPGAVAIGLASVELAEFPMNRLEAVNFAVPEPALKPRMAAAWRERLLKSRVPTVPWP